MYRHIEDQISDMGSRAPNDLVGALVALAVEAPVITAITSASRGPRTWQALGRGGMGLVVVIASSSEDDWSLHREQNKGRPKDAKVHADWYPLSALERISLRDPRAIKTDGQQNEGFTLSAAWEIYLRGRDEPIVLDRAPDGTDPTAVADFVQRLMADCS